MKRSLPIRRAGINSAVWQLAFMCRPLWRPILRLPLHGFTNWGLKVDNLGDLAKQEKAPVLMEAEPPHLGMGGLIS